MFDEVILIILKYCKRSISLFLVSKTFNRLCNTIFIPTKEDFIKSLHNIDIDSVKKLIKIIDINSLGHSPFYIIYFCRAYFIKLNKKIYDLFDVIINDS